MKCLIAKTDKCHIKKMFKTRFVKKAGIVHFQGITSSCFTAEADSTLVVFEQKLISPF